MRELSASCLSSSGNAGQILERTIKELDYPHSTTLPLLVGVWMHEFNEFSNLEGGICRIKMQSIIFF